MEYVHQMVIRNVPWTKKQTQLQLLLIAWSSLQQILKANAEILREFSHFVFHEDKQQVLKCVHKTAIRMLVLNKFPSNRFCKTMLAFSDNSVKSLPTRTSIKYIDSKHFWKNKTEGASLDCPSSPSPCHRFFKAKANICIQRY